MTFDCSSSELTNRRKQTLTVFACDALRRLRKKVKKAGNITSLDHKQRHQVRKAAKKLRYASEFFASQFDGKDPQRKHKRFLDALERLQDKLGALNDLAMTPSVLEKAGLGGSLQPQPQLSTSEKAVLIVVAADAYHDLLDAKRFWK